MSASPEAKCKGKTIVATYDYRDAAGKLLYQSVRYDPKDFKQRQPDGKGGWTWNLKGVQRVLYRLPELSAEDLSQTVFVSEGEKDVDTLVRLGLTATCNVGGAGKWHVIDDSPRHGRPVVILPDNDHTGRDRDIRRGATRNGSRRLVRRRGGTCLFCIG